ncbi:MAG: zinc-ribbon domain-containing protein [Candidatus Odinarchaeia archaeon]
MELKQELDYCPECGSTVYKGRVGGQWGLVFYFKLKLVPDTEDEKELELMKKKDIEEPVALGWGVVNRFNHAYMCRNCLLVFFRAINYRPIVRGHEGRFNISVKEARKTIEKLLKDPPKKVERCPQCGGKLDYGRLVDAPPSGYTPGLIFYMYPPEQAKKKREEPINIGEDFYVSFDEAYFCTNCFLAAIRINKYRPLRVGYWERYLKPTKSLVIALEKRLKRRLFEKEENGNVELSTVFELVKKENFLKKCVYCPSCGVENEEDSSACRNCGKPLHD